MKRYSLSALRRDSRCASHGDHVMALSFGRFRFEASRCGVYVCVPLIGAAWIGGGLTRFDGWAAVRGECR